MSGSSRRRGGKGLDLRDAPSARLVAADLICRLDEHGVVLDCGGGGSIAFSAGELRGRSLASSFPPPAAKEILEALDTLRAGGDAALNLTVTDLNLADWRAFAAEPAPAGIANRPYGTLDIQNHLTSDRIDREIPCHF